MTMTFNREGRRLPVTIIGNVDGRWGNGEWWLIDEDHTDWHRKAEWDQDGKMAFAMFDSCRGQAILMTQEELDAIIND